MSKVNPAQIAHIKVNIKSLIYGNKESHVNNCNIDISKVYLLAQSNDEEVQIFNIYSISLLAIVTSSFF